MGSISDFALLVETCSHEKNEKIREERVFHSVNRSYKVLSNIPDPALPAEDFVVSKVVMLQ